MRSSISVSKRNGFLAAFLGFWILSLLAEYFLLPKRFLLTDICPLAEETYTVVAGHSGYPAAPAHKTLSPEDSEALQKELLRLRLRATQPGESEIIPAGNSYYLEFWGGSHVIRILPYPSGKGAHIEIKYVNGTGEGKAYLEGEYSVQGMHKISR